MVRQSAQTPGHALVKRAEDKILKHDEAYRQTGIVFEKGGGGTKLINVVLMVWCASFA